MKILSINKILFTLFFIFGFLLIPNAVVKADTFYLGGNVYEINYGSSSYSSGSQVTVYFDVYNISNPYIWTNVSITVELPTGGYAWPISETISPAASGMLTASTSWTDPYGALYGPGDYYVPFYLSYSSLYGSGADIVYVPYSVIVSQYYLSVYKAGTGASYGSVTGEGNYTAGTVATATATGGAGATFVNWTGDCNSSGQVTMNSNKSCTANFTIKTYTLTVNTSGTGSGTTTGAGTYNYPATVTATATASAGSTFSGWTGDCNGFGTVYMTSNKTCTAVFTANSYTVTPSAGSNVTISPSTAQTKNYNTTQAFTVTPSAGYTASVGGTCGGSLSGTTYTTNPITASCTVVASASLNAYTVSASAGSGGTISPSSRSVSHGSTTTFTVTPSAGYTASVGGTCGGSLSGTTYTTNAITANCTVVASFTLNAYTVSASAGSGGTISPSSSSVSHGSTTTFTVTPNTGYTASASGCGGSLSGTTYTTGAITSNCTVTASFVANTYPISYTATNGSVSPTSCSYGATVTPVCTPNTGYSTSSCPAAFTCSTSNSKTATFTINTYALTINTAGTGSGTTTGAGTYNYNTAVTATATPSTGSTFSGWSGDCNSSGQVTMTSAKTCTATFAGNTYTVSASAGSGGTISPSSRSVSHGSTTTFTVTPNTGYTASVGGTCGGSLSGTTYTTNAITANCTVVASFTLNTYTVTPSAGSNVTISPSTAQTKNYNTTQAFTVTPSTGYKASVGGTCGGSLSGTTYTTNPITASCTVVASAALMTGTLTPSATSCTIPAGSSTCSVNLTWSTTNPIGTSAVTASGMTDVNGNSGGPTAFTVPYGGRIFFLYNNAIKLAETVNITTSCAAGAWNGSICAEYTVTPSAGSNVTISPSTAQTKNYNTTQAFTVTPSAGYTASVGGTCGGSLSGTTYTTNPITANCTVVASATINGYNLTVTKAGTGAGTVTSNPAGISCGATCTYSYNYNTSVVLTAVASSGSTFTGWSGICSGTGTCTTTIDGSKNVTATFAMNAPAVPTGLSVSPSTCGNNWLNLSWNSSSTATNYKVYRGTTLVYDGSGTFFSDSGLTLGATYSYKVNASNAGGTSADSATVSNTVASVCTYTLTVNTSGSGSGTVTGAGTYNSGTVVTATATPSTGSVFSSWSGDCNSSGQVTMTSAKTCTATFALNTYVLTINTAGTGSGTTTGAGTYNYNTTVTATATPASGSTFSGWSGACNSSGQVTMTSAKTCTATFAMNIPAVPTGLSVSPSTCGNNWLNITWNSSSTATNYKLYRGTTLIYDGSGTSFVDTGLTLGATYSYKVNASNAGGTSAFSAIVSNTVAPICTYVLTITKSGSGSGTVTGAGTYNSGTVVTATATPASGSTFSGWSGACNSSGQVTMTSSKTCTAVFTIPITGEGEVTVVVLPRDGGWTDWSAKNTTCGYSGTQTRTCTNPTPANGGADCVGPSTQAYTNTICPPATPTGFGVVASTCGTNRLNLWWNASDTATNYKVYRGGSLLVYNGSNLAFSDEGLTPGVTYSYTINASNAGGTSANSSPISGTAPPICSYLLTVTKSGSGTGTVTSSPAGISCGSTCSYSYNNNTSVTLTPSPSSGSSFSGWSGDCNSSGQVTMTSAKTCTATFTLNPTGSLSASSCQVASGANSCPSTLTWSTSNPIGTSAVTSSYPTAGYVVVSANSGSQVVTIPYNFRAFYLYNNGAELASTTASATCVSGTSWDGSTCAPLTVNISSVLSSINYNTSTTLNWSTINATTCTASGGWTGTKATSGSVSTGNLTSSTTYTLSCTGLNGTSGSASVAVGVRSSGTLSASPSPCQIALGGSTCSTTLTWNTLNPITTSAVTSSYPTAGYVLANANSGTQATTVPFGSRTFYLYNSGDELASTTVNATCVSGTHWAAGTCVSDNTAPNAPTITIGNSTFYKESLQTFNITGTDPDGDQIRYCVDWDNNNTEDYCTDFTSSGTTMFASHAWPTIGTYSIKARTEDSNSVKSGWSSPLSVTVTNPPVPANITSFTSSSNKIEFGGSVVLTWTSTGATYCEMSSNPSPSVSINSLAPNTMNNNITFKPLKTTIYTLICGGLGGDATEQLTVSVGEIKPIYKEN